MATAILFDPNFVTLTGLCCYCDAGLFHGPHHAPQTAPFPARNYATIKLTGSVPGFASAAVMWARFTIVSVLADGSGARGEWQTSFHRSRSLLRIQCRRCANDLLARIS